MQLRPELRPDVRSWGAPVRRGLAVVAAAALLAFAGCGTQADPVKAAEATVAAKQKALTDAQASATAAAAAFCGAGSDYITALDRYGDVLVKTAPTVGDVQSAGQDLLKPREDTLAAAKAVTDSRTAVTTAEQELAEAEAALENAQAKATGGTPTATAATPKPSPSSAPASVARVQQAESDFATTQAGITAKTPLREAAEEFNSAAVALEMAWLQLFSDAGCLTDSQQKQAVDAAHDYTVALQKALADAGYYEGDVDGIYGPETVAAVKALQKAHGLPQTGAMDKASAAALKADQVAKGGASALESIASTAALQQTLKLAGYWDGDIDGIWTDELTEALKEFQTDLGVPASGKVDSATIAAFNEWLDALKSPSPTPTPTTPKPTPTSSASATPTPTPTATS